MQVGSLVNTPANGVGIVIDIVHCVRTRTTTYLLHYVNGTKHWWTADHLEVICE